MSCRSRIQFHHNPLLCSETCHKKLSVDVIYSTFLQGKAFLNLFQFALRFFHWLSPNAVRAYEYVYRLEKLGTQTPETLLHLQFYVPRRAVARDLQSLRELDPDVFQLSLIHI